MFGIDKLKLVMDIENITNVNEEKFTKKIKGDEVVELSYSQKQPYLLNIKLRHDINEAVIEFSGKVLLSEYHNLIRLSNIGKCIDNINSLGICRIESFMSSDVLACDVTNDYSVLNIKELTSYIRGNISSYSKYNCSVKNNGNLIIEKNVTTRKCKKRMTIYNKGLEMLKPDNQKFLEQNYGDRFPFLGKCRFEINLNSKEQIRSSLKIKDTKLKSVLLSAKNVNPIYDFVEEIIAVDDKYNVNKMKEYNISLVLKDNNYDIKKVEAKLKTLYSKGTKIRAVLKPYREQLKKDNNDALYSRDTILNLVKTETQITQKQIFDIL